jgi:hypothetical protein
LEILQIASAAKIALKCAMPRVVEGGAVVLCTFVLARSWPVTLGAVLLLGVGLLPLRGAEVQRGKLSEPATASGTVTPAAFARASNAARGTLGYFVEFRAAEIGVYGHSYIAYGRLNRSGRPTEIHYADFHPQGGFSGLALGHVVPVAGSFEPEQETLTLPLNAVYRRTLSAAQYAHLLSAIGAAKETHRVWSAEFYNCIHFIVDMAHAVDLKAPPVMLLSAPTVKLIAAMNES